MATIAQNLQALSDARDDIAASIENKGIILPEGAGFRNFASAIDSIETSTPSPVEKDVNFFDYDGTLVYSYTASEFAELTELPPNPVHDGLTAQGWNWTLSDAKAYVSKYGMLIIGQSYITSDGKTRLYISLIGELTSPRVRLYLNANTSVTIDWGDNTQVSTLTSTSAGDQTASHDYANTGNYVISISVNNGSIIIKRADSSTRSLLFYGNPEWPYNALLKKVEIGANTYLADSGFNNKYYNLSSITIPIGSITSMVSLFNASGVEFLTIPKGTTTSDRMSFIRYCHSLRYISLPKSFNSCGQCDYCISLKSITLPESITIGGSVFSDCWSLQSIVAPIIPYNTDSTYIFSSCKSLNNVILDKLTYIPRYMFNACGALGNITIPNTVTRIYSYAFNSSELNSITIPSSVSYIESNAFANCYELKYIKFEGTTPPTLQDSTVFKNLETTTKILVPSGSLSVYRSASYYPSYSTYTYQEY